MAVLLPQADQKRSDRLLSLLEVTHEGDVFHISGREELPQDLDIGILLLEAVAGTVVSALESKEYWLLAEREVAELELINGLIWTSTRGSDLRTGFPDGPELRERNSGNRRRPTRISRSRGDQTATRASRTKSWIWWELQLRKLLPKSHCTRQRDQK